MNGMPRMPKTKEWERESARSHLCGSRSPALTLSVSLNISERNVGYRFWVSGWTAVQRVIRNSRKAAATAAEPETTTNNDNKQWSEQCGCIMRSLCTIWIKQTATTTTAAINEPRETRETANGRLKQRQLLSCALR